MKSFLQQNLFETINYSQDLCFIILINGIPVENSTYLIKQIVYSIVTQEPQNYFLWIQ